jgi:hypothetical protein
MIRVINKSVLRDRVRDFNFTAQQQIASLVQSGVLALAAIVLLEIAYEPDDRIMRIVLWGASLVICLTVFAYLMLNAILAGPRGTGLPVMAMIAGLFEFLMFAILSPRDGADDAWRWWFLIVFLAAALGAGAFHIVLTRWRHDIVDDDLKALEPKQMKWVRVDRLAQFLGMALAGTLAAIALGADSAASWRDPTLLTGAIVFAAASIHFFTIMNQRFNDLLTFVSAADEEPHSKDKF